MRGRLAILLLVAGCSNGPQADLPYISEARSLAAEWSLVNRLSDEGRLRRAYVTAMRAEVRKQLETVADSMSKPDAGYSAQVRSLLALPDDAPWRTLRARSDALAQIEESLESA